MNQRDKNSHVVGGDFSMTTGFSMTNGISLDSGSLERRFVTTLTPPGNDHMSHFEKGIFESMIFRTSLSVGDVSVPWRLLF